MAARRAVRVKTHDFPGQAAKAIPYGIYETATNARWVAIGTDHDTAAFAVASIRRWGQARGRHDYPRAYRLLITADGGGSNGYRTRGWKTQLADPAVETDLEMTVCHLPPGTSKWNKIEHRLFSHITMNWRGGPLTSHEVMLETIAATTSRTGLKVQAELGSGECPTGIRVSDDEIAALPITRHRFHGDWNYTLHPQRPTDTATTAGTPDETQPEMLARLTRRSLQDPELTGMPRRQLNELIDVSSPSMEAQREQVLRTRPGHRGVRQPRHGQPLVDLSRHMHMTTMPGFPSLVLRGNSATARFGDGFDCVHWEQGGRVRRIPLEAIEEVRGLDRSVEAVLTTTDTDRPAAVYAVHHASAPSWPRSVPPFGSACPREGPRKRASTAKN